jgi:peptidoglycan/LPS O-acetylase OafA/YrhL
MVGNINSANVAVLTKKVRKGNARIPNLDLFRASAILMVIVFHSTQIFFNQALPSPAFYYWGKYGVELFFILSGFLVGGLYYKQTNQNLLRFWFLRFFRTYPPYLLALALNFTGVWVFKRQLFNLGFLFFVQNFYRQIPYFLVSWSLCVEEHFYLVFPIIMVITERIIKKKALVIIFWIICSLIPTIIRYKYGHYTQVEFGYYTTATWFRYDGIAMGCLLSYLVFRVKLILKFSSSQNVLILIAIIGLVTLNTIFYDATFMYCFGYLLLNVALLFGLASCYSTASFSISTLKTVQTIAKMAYSLYLTHALVINFVWKITSKSRIHPFFSFVLALVLIFVVGYLFYIFIEKKTIELRDHCFKVWALPRPFK